MNYNKTVKNWKWWVILPITISLIFVLSIPRLIILILNKLVIVVEMLDVGSSKSTSPINRAVSKMNSWTFKGIK